MALPAQGSAPAPAPAPTSEVASAAAPEWAGEESDKPRMKRKTAVRMLIGGSIATVGLLGAGALVAASQLDSKNPASRSAGRVMAIPFAGPFLASSRTGSNDRDRAGIAFIGVEQLAAAAIMTVGAVAVHRHRQYDLARGRERELDRSTTLAMGIGGVLGAAAVYGISVAATRRARKRQPNDFGNLHLVPVAGGYLAAPHARSNTSAVLSVASSTLQVAGVAVAAAGLAMGVRRRNRESRVAVLPWASGTQAQVTAVVRF
jgi:hypothetical protein